MSNTADVTGDNPIALWSQSITGVNAINPLVAFYDIYLRCAVNPLVALYDLHGGSILLFWYGTQI
jgi:hypothetical protein